MLYLMNTLIKEMPGLCRTDYGFTSVLEKQDEAYSEELRLYHLTGKLCFLDKFYNICRPEKD